MIIILGQNISDDSSSSMDNVGLLSRDRGTSSLQLSDSDPEGAAGKTTNISLEYMFFCMFLKISKVVVSKSLSYGTL